MTSHTRKWLSDRFNNAGSNLVGMMTDPKLIVRSFVTGLAMMPLFGMTIGLSVMAGPTLFTGVGQACCLAGRAFEPHPKDGPNL